MANLRDIEVDDYFAACLEVAPEAIQEEFVRVPAEMGYWGERAASALKRYKLARAARELAEATAYLTHKASTERATVDQVKALVECDDAVKAAKATEIEAEAEAAAERNRYEAIRGKKDVLQSMGAILRAEMERDPVVRSRARGDWER